MSEHRSVRVLRRLVLLELAFFLLLLPLELYLDAILPEPLVQQIAAQDEAIPDFALWLFIPMLAVYLAALYGLYRLWPPARSLYVVLTVLGILLGPVFGHEIIHAWAVPLNWTASLVSGAILALVYLSPAAASFARADAA